jgi:predicted NAD/FAD-dependent oxidoreductase
LSTVNQTRTSFDSVIIGAGLSGLSVAHKLQKFDTLILEQTSNAGGRIDTRWYNDCAYDVGAVLGYDPAYVPFEVAHFQTLEETGRTGLFFDNHLYLGSTVEECLEGAFHSLPADLAAIREMYAGTSGIGSLSPQARDTINAFFQVIHPGEIEEYLPEFQRQAFLSYKPRHYVKGNGGLIDEYIKRTNSRIEYNAQVIAIETINNHREFRVFYSRYGKTHDVSARTVVVAATASTALKLVPAMRDRCRRFLESVRYGSFTVVALGLNIISFEDDFSYIVFPGERVSTIYKMTFPESSVTVLLFYYCSRVSQELMSNTDEQFVHLSKECAASAGIVIAESDILFSDIHRWPEGGTIISSESRLLWSPEHISPAKGVFLAGDYMHKSFPYGMEAAIRSGLETAEAVSDFLEASQTGKKGGEGILLPRDSGRDCVDDLIELGRKAIDQPLPMTCIPPEPDLSYSFGDLVPLGFLVRALGLASDHPEAETLQERLSEYLNRHKQNSLWAFHRGHLVTSTDSALILLGLSDYDAVEALEIFHDGNSAYYPQLWSEIPRPDHMTAMDAYRHWCRADYGTSCFIRGLRRAHNLAPGTSAGYLTAGFERRSGLYFANPYLVDWALSMAISGDPEFRELRFRLLGEVMASRRDDGSFGNFDRLMSTALAVLTLTQLGYSGDFLVNSRTYLEQSGMNLEGIETARPFYSSEIIDDNPDSFQRILQLKALNGDNVCEIGKCYHAISYYEDTYDIICRSLVFLALREQPRPDSAQRKASVPSAVHPRYCCADQAEYIRCFALPPYTEDL